jgi:Bacterial Ig domain
VTINVVCTNDAPVAVDDIYSSTGGTLQTMSIGSNDTDIDTVYSLQVFTPYTYTNPAHGTLSIVGNNFEYLPNAPYYGSDSFTYTIIDQSGAVSANTGTVTISVAPGGNIAPVVSNSSFTLNEDDSTTQSFSGFDINVDPLTYSASTLPTNGTLTIVGTGFTYAPNTHFHGSDSFTFFANDGLLDSSGATISLTVSPVDDAPVAVDDTVVVQMNSGSNTPTPLTVLVNDTDADNPSPLQIFTITGLTQPTSGTAAIVGNAVEYTPNILYLGSDSFTYTISDQNGNISGTATVNITVSTTNQVPVADSASGTTLEDTALIATLSGSDADGTPVSYVIAV